jgi:four helix bundle protein
MTYKQFEDLPVWQAAIDLKCMIDDFCELPVIRSRPNWVDQIDRSSLSISNNIAEGFERGTSNELLTFLYIARGSAGETRSMLRYAARRRRLAHLLPQIDSLIELALSVSRQLGAWADSVQNCDIKGQRYLTDQSRASYQRNKRADELWRQLREAHRARFEKLSADDERTGEGGDDAVKQQLVSRDSKSESEI